MRITKEKSLKPLTNTKCDKLLAHDPWTSNLCLFFYKSICQYNKLIILSEKVTYSKNYPQNKNSSFKPLQNTKAALIRMKISEQFEITTEPCNKNSSQVLNLIYMANLKQHLHLFWLCKAGSGLHTFQLLYAMVGLQQLEGQPSGAHDTKEKETHRS